MSSLVFDLLLLVALLWAGWRTLATPDPFSAAVLFIAFGLLMALAWARLDAPDVAIAEAAIGAGLTGALVLDAVGREHAAAASRRASRKEGLRALPMVVVALCLALAIVLAFAMLALGEPPRGVPVAAAMGESGVSHPVTAVLLNFRGYDTLLEVTVLLLALMGVLAAGAELPHPSRHAGDPVLGTLVRVLLPVMVVTAAYLLWAGSTRPGGAFQAGAVLAASGVLLRLGGFTAVWSPSDTWLRGLSCAGLVVFLFIAGVVRGDRLLAYPPGWAGALILVIEASLTVSIGAMLAGFFLSAPAHRPPPGRPE